METMVQDLRYAVRVLRKNPGFTMVTVFTLALGIGATTAIFGVVYGVLLRPLPYDRPDQIVQLWEMNSRGQRMNFADPNFEDIRARNASLQGLAEFGAGVESVSGGSEPTRTDGGVGFAGFLSPDAGAPSVGAWLLAGESSFRGGTGRPGELRILETISREPG